MQCIPKYVYHKKNTSHVATGVDVHPSRSESTAGLHSNVDQLAGIIQIQRKQMLI